MKKKAINGNELHIETIKCELMKIWLILLQHGLPVGNNYQLEDIRNKSKLQGLYDFKKIRSCVDLIEDTEDAIIEFFTFQLSTTPEDPRLGEKYLRLYGILNAIYLQIQAIIQLAELVKCPNKTALEKGFNNLKITEIRHIAGAHTINFIATNSSKFKAIEGPVNSFRLTQTELNADGSNITIVDAFGSYEKINLKKEIVSYLAKSDATLIDVTKKYISTLFKNNQSKKVEFFEMIDELKEKSINYECFNKNVDVEKKLLKEISKMLKGVKSKKSKAKNFKVL